MVYLEEMLRSVEQEAIATAVRPEYRGTPDLFMSRNITR